MENNTLTDTLASLCDRRVPRESLSRLVQAAQKDSSVMATIHNIVKELQLKKELTETLTNANTNLKLTIAAVSNNRRRSSLGGYPCNIPTRAKIRKTSLDVAQPPR